MQTISSLNLYIPLLSIVILGWYKNSCWCG